MVAKVLINNILLMKIIKWLSRNYFKLVHRRIVQLRSMWLVFKIAMKFKRRL